MPPKHSPLTLHTKIRTRKAICPRCQHHILRRTRHFATNAQQNHLQQENDIHLPSSPPPRSGHVKLTNRALISLSGRDTTSFLQGLITHNIASHDRTSSGGDGGGVSSIGGGGGDGKSGLAYTAFLNAQGRVLNDAFIYPGIDGGRESSGNGGGDPSYLVEVDRAQVGNMFKHLKKHKLRAKLQMRILDEGECDVWAVWDDNDGAASHLQLQHEESNLALYKDPRVQGFGSRLLLPSSSTASSFPQSTSPLPLSSYTLRRILYGIPEGQSEILPDTALPMESNMDFMSAIDFRKGCYVGQELTIRTHHTGIVRKRILPVQLFGAEEVRNDAVTGDMPIYDPRALHFIPPAGTDIIKAPNSTNPTTPSPRRGRSAGKFLTGIGNVGLALCRLEMMTDVSVTGKEDNVESGTKAAVVGGGGFDPQQTRFKISWGDGEEMKKEVMAKAFVPSWVRAGVEGGQWRKGKVEAKRWEEEEERLGPVGKETERLKENVLVEG